MIGNQLTSLKVALLHYMYSLYCNMAPSCWRWELFQETIRIKRFLFLYPSITPLILLLPQQMALFLGLLKPQLWARLPSTACLHNNALLYNQLPPIHYLLAS